MQEKHNGLHFKESSLIIAEVFPNWIPVAIECNVGQIYYGPVGNAILRAPCVLTIDLVLCRAATKIRYSLYFDSRTIA